jgi:calmodulin
METPGAAAPGYDRRLYGGGPDSARSGAGAGGGQQAQSGMAGAFAGLGERVPDPVDMQRAMAPRCVPPGGDGTLSPRLAAFGKGGTPRRMRYSFLSGQNTRFLSSDTMNDIAASHLRTEVVGQSALGGGGGNDDDELDDALAGTGVGGGSGGGEGGSPRRRADPREEYAFSRKWKKVELDLSPKSVKKSADLHRKRQSKQDVRNVFDRIDMKNDDKVDAEEVEALLKGLGYSPQPGEVQDMIWEVDDDCDGVLNWKEFQSVYNRVRADPNGKEPRRMYTIIEFCLFDLDESGVVGLDEVQESFYRRYGKIADLKRREMIGFITFKQFVKRDTAFYSLSRQIEDSQKEADASTRKKMLADLQEEGVPKEDAKVSILQSTRSWRGNTNLQLSSRKVNAFTPRGAMSQYQTRHGLRKMKPPSATGRLRSHTARATRQEEQLKKAANHKAKAAHELQDAAARERANQAVRAVVRH